MEKNSFISIGSLLKLAALATLAAIAPAGQAQTTIFSTGFESPAYVAGASVVGVDGFAVGSSGSASQTVTNTRGQTGTQSLLFDNTGANTSFYSVLHSVTPFAPNVLSLSVSVYIPSTNGVDRLADVMFSTGTLGSCVLGLSVDGAGDIRMGKAWASLYGTTFLATAAAGTFADRWLTATLSYDPTSKVGTTTVSGFGGATPSYTSSFTAVTSPTNTNLGSDYITTTAPTGAVYFDNLVVSAVPEPSAAALLLTGVSVLGLAIIRRQAALRA